MPVSSSRGSQTFYIFIFLRRLSRNSEVNLTSFHYSFYFLFFTLKAQLDKKRDDFCNKNLKASSDHCSALLKDIFSPLEEGVKKGIYSKPGGYRLFIEKIQELKKKYLQEPRKGIQVTKIDSGKLLTCSLKQHDQAYCTQMCNYRTDSIHALI